MFNKYYMFSEEIDTKLMELGFKLTRDGYKLKYENICQEGSLLIKYEIHKDSVSAQRIFIDNGTSSNNYCTIFENETFEEIICKLEKCLHDLRERYSFKVSVKESDYVLNHSKSYGNEMYRMEVNDSTFNRLCKRDNKQEDKQEDNRKFGFTKVFTGTPVYLNGELKDDECRIYY